MAATKFFRFAFAVGGDVAAVPDVPPGDGSVNYTSGYPIEYQADQSVDPDYLDVERTKFNQIQNDVTTALQQYQTIGIPNFVTASQNGGVAFPYALYSFCLYDDGSNGPRVFQSKKATNTDLPTVATSWRWVNNTSSALVFDGVTFAAGVANGNAVYWDSVNSWYAKALAGDTLAGNMVGIADVTFGRVYNAGSIAILSGLTPGAIYYLSDTVAGALTLTKPNTVLTFVGVAKSATELFLNVQIQLSSAVPTGVSLVYRGITPPAGFLLEDGSLLSRTAEPALFAALTEQVSGTLTSGSPTITGLADTSFMFDGMAVTNTNLPSGTTILSVDSSSQVTLDANATSTVVSILTFYMYSAGDGLTTFGIPDTRRTVDVGRGGVGSAILGNRTGMTGGEEAHTMLLTELVDHTHGGGAKLGTGGGPNSTGGSLTDNYTTDNAGGGVPFNVMQPSLVSTKMIKT